MNPIIPVIAIAAIIFGGQYLRKGDAIQNLVTTPLSAKIKKKAGFFSNLISPELLLTLKVDNPNRTSVTFQSIKGQLIQNGLVMSSFDYKKEITVPKQDSAILKDMNLRVNMSNELTSVLNALSSNKPADSTITCKGTIISNGMTYPFTKQIKLGLS